MTDIIRVRAKNFSAAKKIALINAGKGGYKDIGRGKTILKPTTTSNGIFDFIAKCYDIYDF